MGPLGGGSVGGLLRRCPGPRLLVGPDWSLVRGPHPNCFPMKILCWNIRGFSQEGQRCQLIDYVSQEDMDIMVIQDMIRQDSLSLRCRDLVATSSHDSGSWPPATRVASS